MRRIRIDRCLNLYKNEAISYLACIHDRGRTLSSKLCSIELSSKRMMEECLPHQLPHGESRRNDQWSNICHALQS